MVIHYMYITVRNGTKIKNSIQVGSV